MMFQLPTFTSLRRIWRHTAGVARTSLAIAVLCWLTSVLFAAKPAPPVDLAKLPPAATKTIDFNRDIRPIFSETCFTCHGPDANKRKAGLRFDTKDGVFAKLESGNFAVVPGNARQSQLLQRVATTDEDERMPPTKTGKTLSTAQVGLLRAWIEQGAQWKPHWAYLPPERPAPPSVKDAKWARNPIDLFISAKLEEKGLTPSVEADKQTLLRRVTLDVTGLPPTPDEVKAFLLDRSANAYEKVVDRLLASPRYGERMAMSWLDGARYGDSHGYQSDNERFMWPWRDWVINAFNANMPFDRFTIEQIAGDLLPNATAAQRVATGFNRNHRITGEGGSIPEEWRTEYVIDRVETTSAVWLGLTMGCCRCHDHKYDPISQKEFYQFFAFFNNVPEQGVVEGASNHTPLIKIATAEQETQRAEIVAAITEQERTLRGPLPAVDAAQVAWEKEAVGKSTEWVVLEPTTVKAAGGATFTKRDDKSIFVSGPNPDKDTFTINAPCALKDITAIRVEALPDDAFAGKGPGRSVNGNIVLSGVRLSAGAVAVKFKAASADFSQDNYPVANAIDEKSNSGWAIHPEVGKPHFAVFETEHPVNGPLTITLEFQSQVTQHALGRFRLSVTDSKDPHNASKVPPSIVAILAMPSEQRTAAHKAELQKFYREKVSPEIKAIHERIAALKKQETELDAKIPNVMVMEEMPKPRDAFILIRGQYDKHGDKVTAGTPAVLPPLPSNMPTNRLALAKWLVDPANPLTARVAVNRYWEKFFGAGLCKTTENLGSQADWPTHPELLDWLATEFVRLGWDMKAIQHAIVTSATYRQSSRVTPALQEKDPENRWLARGPRFRLSAEAIRDNALAISGLLREKIGGPSVRPYQPAAIWDEVNFYGNLHNYKNDTDGNQYRRSLYTIWKRTTPPPGMMLFDMPSREVCVVRRARTNTPLQALALLNEPTYVEAARVLAARMLKEGGPTPDQRIAFAYRHAVARRPTSAELAVLTAGLRQRLVKYHGDVDAARKLVTVGEARPDGTIDVADLAAYTMTASVILNLDETITKE